MNLRSISFKKKSMLMLSTNTLKNQSKPRSRSPNQLLSTPNRRTSLLSRNTQPICTHPATAIVLDPTFIHQDSNKILVLPVLVFMDNNTNTFTVLQVLTTSSTRRLSSRKLPPPTTPAYMVLVLLELVLPVLECTELVECTKLDYQ